MTKNKTSKRAISEEEIDNLVESQADNDDAWDEPIQVKRKQAAFLARLHKENDTTEWLKRIIAERIELEDSLA